MLIALLILDVLILFTLVALLLRKQPGAQGTDPRLEQQLTRIDARSESLDKHVRAEFEAMRRELAAEAQNSRTELAASITELRNSTRLSLETTAQRLTSFTTETNQQHTQLRESLNAKLNELMASNTTLQDRLRSAVEERLNKLNTDNNEKLEKMRETVDEKLEKTLNERLTQSFGQVTTHLGEVQKGLGEMRELATGVGDLKKVLSNVKSRGQIGELILEQQLAQMFSPEQYEKNVRTRTDTQEVVEFALKIPNGPDSTVLLVIDSKFPTEDWERLDHAYELGSEEDRKKASAAFERAIRTQGKKICDKYINVPTTLPFGLMFLPSEAIYAEVMRRPGLHTEIQSKCNVVIAGPSNLMMILTSFQMVFQTLKFQKNLTEVWKVFGLAQSEFEKFGGLMEKVERNVGTVQNTLKKISSKTKTINRAFRDVSSLELGPHEVQPLDAVLPLLTDNEEGDEEEDEGEKG